MRTRGILICCLMTALSLLAGCGWSFDNALGDHTSTTTTTTSGITITPSSATVAGGGTYSFSAISTGAAGPDLIWSVVEPGGGSITPDGLYTAPQTVGTYHVKATSSADTGLFALATVTVASGLFPQTWKSDAGIAPAVTLTVASVSGDNTRYYGTIQCPVLQGGSVEVSAPSPYNFILANGSDGYYFQALNIATGSTVTGRLSPVAGVPNQLSGTLIIIDGAVSAVTPVYSSTSALFIKN